MRTDKERLDALQGLSTGYGYGWLLRLSTTGRGMRLHETSMPGSTPNVRDAIDQYLDYIEDDWRSDDVDQDS